MNKMKKSIIGAVAVVTLLISGTANALILFNDMQAVSADDPGGIWSFAGNADESLSLNTNHVNRQAAGTKTSTYSVDCVGGGSGIHCNGFGTSITDTIFRTKGGGHCVRADVDYNFGPDVAGKLWSVSTIERKTGSSSTGPYSYLAVGSSPIAKGAGIGYGAGVIAIEGYVNGRLDLWTNGVEVSTVFGVGLTGRDFTYTLNFDEVDQTVYAVVTASGNTYNLGTNSFSGIFSSSDRYIEKRNYLAGGGTSTDWYVKNLTVSVVPEPATVGFLALLGLAFLRRK